MASNPIKGNSESTYLLILDLPEMMEAYERIGLQIPSVAFLKERQCCLAAELQRVIPDCYVEAIEFNELTNKIVSLLHNLLLNTPEAVVISTVRDVASKMGGHCIQINRLVDPSGRAIGVGPRPGNGSFYDQISGMKGVLEDHPVILVEDGSFSGATMKCMIEVCTSMKIEIEHLVAGFLFSSARETLRKIFPKMDNIHCWREGNFVDWMPDHDFFPFVPNAGKVVGFTYNSHKMPVYLHNGLSLCLPYILPYGNPVEWASIPAEHAKKFSIFCMQQTRQIFWEMERLNNRKITLESLVKTYPRVGLPVYNIDKDFPHIKARIVDILLHHEHAVELS